MKNKNRYLKLTGEKANRSFLVNAFTGADVTVGALTIAFGAAAAYVASVDPSQILAFSASAGTGALFGIAASRLKKRTITGWYFGGINQYVIDKKPDAITPPTSPHLLSSSLGIRNEYQRKTAFMPLLNLTTLGFTAFFMSKDSSADPGKYMLLFTSLSALTGWAGNVSLIKRFNNVIDDTWRIIPASAQRKPAEQEQKEEKLVPAGSIPSPV
jgi:hypothetical protein